MTKTVLITGASAGVGKATAELCAKLGYSVYASMRDLAKGASLQAWAEEKGHSLELVEIDVKDDRSVSIGIQRILEEKGGLDVFVNNAGIVSLGALEDTKFETTKDVFETNYFGALRCLKEIVPHFREKRAGTIVFVSSQSGLLAQAGLGTYCASKWALECLAETTSLELAPFGADVYILEPGGIMSPLQQEVEPFPTDTPYEQVYARFMQWNAIDYQQCAVPEDIARAAVEAIEGKQKTLRKATDFAGRNIEWRAGLSDEQWRELYAETDQKKWIDLWVKRGGVDVSSVQ
jgi:NAD(P)-dependent dehydrogenase (short-subunit alcohol dehydrogenase family)